MRTRTKGITVAGDGSRIVNKEYQGERIYQRLGNVSQDEAEAWLCGEQAAADTARTEGLRRGGGRLWADAARKYLIECEKRQVKSLAMIGRHVVDLLPFIGAMPIQDVCNDALEAFKLERSEDDGVKNSTINRTL